MLFILNVFALKTANKQLVGKSFCEYDHCNNCPNDVSFLNLLFSGLNISKCERIRKAWLQEGQPIFRAKVSLILELITFAHDMH